MSGMSLSELRVSRKPLDSFGQEDIICLFSRFTLAYYVEKIQTGIRIEAEKSVKMLW